MLNALVPLLLALAQTAPGVSILGGGGAFTSRGNAFPRARVIGPTAVIQRCSADAWGLDGNGESKHPSISADGRWVVFESDATNLGPLDANPARDIYVRDRDADGNGLFDEPGQAALALVSIASDGSAADASNFDPSISADGRHVTFTTSATNLVPGDTNGVMDIVVHDRDVDGDGIFDEPGQVATLLASISSGGAPGNGLCALPKISADGRHVAFESFASNLAAGDANAERDVFVHDRDPDGNGILDEGNAVTVLISFNTLGFAGNASSSGVSLSADGRFVVFESAASDLVSVDTNGQTDVFMVDRDPDANGVFDEGNAALRRMSLGPGGVQASGLSRRPHVSADGRHVVFESDAANLGPSDLNAFRDVYTRDRDPDGNGLFDEGNGINRLMSVPSGGGFATNNSIYARISATGRVVAFVSFATNLVPGDNNNTFDVFARDRDPDGNGILDEGNAVTLLLSRSAGGQIGDQLSGNGEISADGRYKAFATDATNFDPLGDTNGLRDIYVRRVY